jgi:hypothetical protein
MKQSASLVGRQAGHNAASCCSVTFLYFPLTVLSYLPCFWPMAAFVCAWLWCNLVCISFYLNEKSDLLPSLLKKRSSREMAGGSVLSEKGVRCDVSVDEYL